MRTFLCTALVLALAPVALAGGIVINEVDADQTSTDSVEFIELFGDAGANLGRHFLVFYNGNATNDAEYDVFSLNGQSIPADGYFVMGAATVANVDYTPSGFPATNAIQNGADAIALWFDPSGGLSESAFFGTTPTTPPGGVTLIDAIVYGTSDPDDAALIAALGVSGQVDEDLNGNKDTESIQRTGDGGTPLDWTALTVDLPTPGAANGGGVPDPWTNLGFDLAGAGGEPELSGTGSLQDGTLGALDLFGAAASAPTALFVGLANNPTPFKGGQLVPVPALLTISLSTDGKGGYSLPFVWPSGIAPGTLFYFHVGIQDGGAPFGVALSNALQGEAQ